MASDVSRGIRTLTRCEIIRVREKAARLMADDPTLYDVVDVRISYDGGPAYTVGLTLGQFAAKCEVPAPPRHDQTEQGWRLYDEAVRNAPVWRRAAEKFGLRLPRS